MYVLKFQKMNKKTALITAKSRYIVIAKTRSLEDTKLLSTKIILTRLFNQHEILLHKVTKVTRYFASESFGPLNKYKAAAR